MGEHIGCISIGREHGIEDLLDSTAPIHEGQPLDVPPIFERERWQSKGLDKRERGVAQQFVRKLETFDSFSLPFRFVRAEAVHGRSELGQFGVAVAERARLRRASPGPRDRIPCRGRRLIRPSGVGIAKDHAEPGQPRDVHRSSRRRRKPDRGKPAPGEVIARAVVDGDG